LDIDAVTRDDNGISAAAACFFFFGALNHHHLLDSPYLLYTATVACRADATYKMTRCGLMAWWRRRDVVAFTLSLSLANMVWTT
jgi:hypothetical protein